MLFGSLWLVFVSAFRDIDWRWSGGSFFLMIETGRTRRSSCEGIWEGRLGRV